MSQPKFYDGNIVDRLARPEGAAARIINRKVRVRNSRSLKALMEALIGDGVGATATSSYPYVVQATDGRTGGLVSIGTKYDVNRPTTVDDKNDIYALLGRAESLAEYDTLDFDFILDVSRLS